MTIRIHESLLRCSKILGWSDSDRAKPSKKRCATNSTSTVAAGAWCPRGVGPYHGTTTTATTLPFSAPTDRLPALRTNGAALGMVIFDLKTMRDGTHLSPVVGRFTVPASAATPHSPRQNAPSDRQAPSGRGASSRRATGALDTVSSAALRLDKVQQYIVAEDLIGNDRRHSTRGAASAAELSDTAPAYQLGHTTTSASRQASTREKCTLRVSGGSF
jgi:hypothetical protein